MHAMQYKWVEFQEQHYALVVAYESIMFHIRTGKKLGYYNVRECIDGSRWNMQHCFKLGLIILCMLITYVNAKKWLLF